MRCAVVSFCKFLPCNYSSFSVQKVAFSLQPLTASRPLDLINLASQSQEAAREKISPLAVKLRPGSPDAPQKFGKYMLLGLIARGGMAEVYRARMPGDPRLLAMKCMRPALAREARFVDMFIREGKIAVLLNHDSIVRTFEIGRVAESGGRYFIAMEYLSGRDLIQVLRRCQESGQRIPIPHACYIAAKMCDGLGYAHTRVDAEGRPLSIINRDVSPSNVRVSYDGDVKLLDFGIAQAALKFTSEIGVLKGKFSYMSPEQIRGMPLDARTDIFSVGIVLHEMLTTEKLFRGDTEFALMERVRRADVPAPSKFNRRVPRELDRIVLRALSREVGDRYASARELAEDLRSFATSYRFEVREMQDLLRGLFPSEYEEECKELAACSRATPCEGEPTDDELRETIPLSRLVEEQKSAADETPVVPARSQSPSMPARGRSSATLWNRIINSIK